MEQPISTTLFDKIKHFVALTIPIFFDAIRYNRRILRISNPYGPIQHGGFSRHVCRL